jgi:hypothetical protein
LEIKTYYERMHLAEKKTIKYVRFRLSWRGVTITGNHVGLPLLFFLPVRQGHSAPK